MSILPKPILRRVFDRIDTGSRRRPRSPSSRTSASHGLGALDAGGDLGRRGLGLTGVDLAAQVHATVPGVDAHLV
jgi:hypothetical protein